MKQIVMLTYSLIYILTMGDLADDAYISMRYAQNLWDHGQLVWVIDNPVMGFTNLGFTLIMTVAHIFPTPTVIIQLINLIIILLLIHLLYKNEGWLAGVLVAINGSMFLWAQWGMESGLQALCVVMAFYHRKYLLLWLCVAFIVRADGIIFVALGLIYTLTHAKIKTIWKTG